MTEGQINELLAGIISVYAPEFGRVITEKAALKLAVSHVEEQIRNVGPHAYALAKTAFSECGTIFEENIKDCIIAGVILSGTANMNPAFVLLWIEGGHIHLTASAKEGLIKQHTAQRAVEAFKSALSRAEG